MSEYKINHVGCRPPFTVSCKQKGRGQPLIYEFSNMVLEVELRAETPEHLPDIKIIVFTGLAGTWCYKPAELYFTTDVNLALRRVCEKEGIPLAAGSRGNLLESAEPRFQFIIWGEHQRQELVEKERKEKL